MPWMRSHEGLLDFRRIGPLPPYTFADRGGTVPTFEEVDDARAVAGIRKKGTIATRSSRHIAGWSGRPHPMLTLRNLESDSLVSELAGAYRFPDGLCGQFSQERVDGL